MAVTDVTTKEWVQSQAAFLQWIVPAAFALVVVVAGKVLAARKSAEIKPIVDLADENTPKQ